jgi:O-acetylserine/cysteine efflux transporter
MSSDPSPGLAPASTGPAPAGATRHAVRASLPVVVLVLAWGTTFAAVKVGLDGAPPFLFAGMRSVLGGAAIAVLALVRTGPPVLRGRLGDYATVTLLNVIGFFSLQTLAILTLPSGLAAVLIYLQPVLTGVLAAPLLGERLHASKLVGLLLGFAGIVVVSAGALQGHVSLGGVGWAVSAALVWSLGTIAFKRTQDRPEPVDPMWAVALSFLVGGLLLTVLGAAVEPGHVTWSGGFLVALAYSGLIGTALSWGLWFGLVSAGEASRASSYIFFVPVVSLAVGAVLLGERVGLSLLLGGALVIAGVWLANRKPAG